MPRARPARFDMLPAMSYAAIAALIGLLILVHEAGHFWAARLLGLPVARFSIGFGPRLWGWRRGRTEYRISALPLGGYVLLDLADAEDYFRIPLARRIAFSAAGPLANFLLPLPLFALLNVLDGGLTLQGVLVAPLTQTLDAALRIAALLPSVFASPENLSGLVGIVAQSSELTLSFERTLGFTIMMSVNLAIFNLLPLPLLDGGKIAVDLLHRVSPRGVLRYLEPVTAGGLLLLVALFVLVTALDLFRLAA
jgi:regulator of sigma E protease